ncbi:hypothetical protein B0H19DRAFT_1083371 [Mycena capillaripes]|nr:hypothetical protein B0H19DRAFT_1083371 [Mycena capillaripes]
MNLLRTVRFNDGLQEQGGTDAAASGERPQRRIGRVAASDITAVRNRARAARCVVVVVSVGVRALRQPPHARKQTRRVDAEMEPIGSADVGAATASQAGFRGPLTSKRQDSTLPPHPTLLRPACLVIQLLKFPTILATMADLSSNSRTPTYYTKVSGTKEIRKDALRALTYFVTSSDVNGRREVLNHDNSTLGRLDRGRPRGGRQNVVNCIPTSSGSAETNSTLRNLSFAQFMFQPTAIAESISCADQDTSAEYEFIGASPTLPHTFLSYVALFSSWAIRTPVAMSRSRIKVFKSTCAMDSFNDLLPASPFSTCSLLFFMACASALNVHGEGFENLPLQDPIS